MQSYLGFAMMPVAGLAQLKDYRDLLNVVWENRKELPYAWNILTHGVCDACSLGPYGIRDSVLDGVHLCMNRLKLMKVSTMAPLDIALLTDINRLRRLSPDQLRSLGRLAYPMMRRKGEPCFLRVSWEEALQIICKTIHETAPHQMAFCATPRSPTNEVYYVFQKLARVLGTNNIDLYANEFDGASISGLQSTLGYGAPSCSLSDLIGTDLLVLFGSDIADHQPVTTQYLDSAKKAGTHIVLVSGKSLEPKLTGSFFQVQVGGHTAFINGVLKTLIANDQIDHSFIAGHTAGFRELKTALEQQPWEMIERRSGVARAAMQRFAAFYGAARTAVMVYGASISEPECAADNVKAIVNLVLARGMIGRQWCGILPMRRYANAQGGGECGVEPDHFPGGFPVNDQTARRFSNLWHHPVPSNPGLKAPQMIESAYQGEIKFLYSMGADLLDQEKRGNKFVAEALTHIPVRVHQDFFLNASMLLETDKTVVLLPGQTRYEQTSGGTSTSTERRIRFTPEISGHKIGETLPEWEIAALIGRKSMPNGDKLFPFDNSQTIREEISRVMPIYRGIEKLTEEGDQYQWGGPQLYSDGFTMMPANRALFTAIEPAETTERIDE